MKTPRRNSASPASKERVETSPPSRRLKIVCLVKQVPHPEAIQFDPEEKRLRREGVPLELNPFDRAAVRASAAVRDLVGGELVTMTMGPPQAEEALRETLALGADRCVHLSDQLFAVADTLGTSRTLALAIEREGADLVVCGRKTVDAETWQVPPELAAFLDRPVLTGVVSLEIEGGRARAVRETDEGEETFELELPAVVSIAHADPHAVEPAPNDGRIAVWRASDLVPDVQPNDTRFGQRGSPTRVLAVRDAAPIRRAEAVEGAGAAAELVLALLAERAPDRPSWEKPSHVAEQPGASYDSWSVVEVVDGRPSRPSLELLARSRELAGKLGGRAAAVVIGEDVTGIATEIAHRGAEDVYLIENPGLASYHPGAWAAALEDLLEEHRPHVLLIPASARGREYGPLLAGRLELGMTGDCVGVDIAKAGRLLQTKPAYGGNIVSVIMGATTPQLATVRARMYEPLERRDDVDATIYHLPLAAEPDPRLRLVSRDSSSRAYTLDEANVVVLAGPEIGAEGVRELDDLGRFPGATVGGTREVCAAGWLPRNRHVGLFGRQVAPLLLVAVGVPGDFEHVTGFVKARVTVAFGDVSAPMARAADVAVAADWRETLPRFHELVAPHIH